MSKLESDRATHETLLQVAAASCTKAADYPAQHQSEEDLRSWMRNALRVRQAQLAGDALVEEFLTGGAAISGNAPAKIMTDTMSQESSGATGAAAASVLEATVVDSWFTRIATTLTSDPAIVHALLQQNVDESSGASSNLATSSSDASCSPQELLFHKHVNGGGDMSNSILHALYRNVPNVGEPSSSSPSSIQSSSSAMLGSELWGYCDALRRVVLEYRLMTTIRAAATCECEEDDIAVATREEDDIDEGERQRIRASRLYDISVPIVLQHIRQQQHRQKQQQGHDHDSNNTGETFCDWLVLALLSGEPNTTSLLEPMAAHWVMPLLKRAQFHFRDGVEGNVVQTSNIVTVGGQTDTGGRATASDRDESAEQRDDAIDNEPATAAATVTTSNDAEVKAPLTLFSVDHPEHYLAYALVLSEELRQSVVELPLDEPALLVVEDAGNTTHRHIADSSLADNLRSALAVVVDTVFWFHALGRLGRLVDWASLVDQLSEERHHQRKDRHGHHDSDRRVDRGGANHHDLSLTQKRFIHLFNCLVDTTRRSTLSSASVSNTDTVNSCVFHCLMAADEYRAVRVWCRIHVQRLLFVCNEESTDSTLWRRRFLLAPRRRHVLQATDDNGDDHEMLSVGKNDVSPVVLKFFRGLFTIASTSLDFLLRSPVHQQHDTNNSSTGRHYARRTIWSLLVCNGVKAFGGAFDLTAARNQSVLQSVVGEHLDGLFKLLMGSAATSTQQKVGSAKVLDTLLTPSELLAAIF